ncbi:MAG: hypothetical protein NVSMB5_24950 [Candidatus Velthaea sp.]
MRVAAGVTLCALVTLTISNKAYANDVTRLALGSWHGAPAVSRHIHNFALHISGRPGATIDLRASDVPTSWLVSFCTGRTCSLRHTTVTLPRGERSVEISYIPKTPGARPPALVHVTAKDGIHRTELRRPFAGATSN